MEYREITSFENMPFLFSRRKAGLLPPRPLRDLCASARKNGDVTARQTIPLQSDNPIFPTRYGMLKNRLVTSALLREKTGTLLPAKRYLYRVTTLFLPHTARDAEKQTYHLRALCEKKQGCHCLTNDNLYRMTTLFLPHCTRCWK